MTRRRAVLRPFRSGAREERFESVERPSPPKLPALRPFTTRTTVATVPAPVLSKAPAASIPSSGTPTVETDAVESHPVALGAVAAQTIAAQTIDARAVETQPVDAQTGDAPVGEVSIALVSTESEAVAASPESKGESSEPSVVGDCWTVAPQESLGDEEAAISAPATALELSGIRSSSADRAVLLVELLDSVARRIREGEIVVAGGAPLSEDVILQAVLSVVGGDRR